MLERHGVDADRIRLIGTPGVGAPRVEAAQREADMATTRRVGVRGFSTAIVVSVLAAAVGGLLVWFASDGDLRATLIAAVPLFVAGGALGFFYGGATGLAVSDEWAETFEARGPATLAVHVPPDAVDDMVHTLESTHPTDLMVA